MLEFGVVSHLSAAVVYGLLAGFTATRYLRRNSDRAVLLASILTTLWALIVVAQNVVRMDRFHHPLPDGADPQRRLDTGAFRPGA